MKNKAHLGDGGDRKVALGRAMKLSRGQDSHPDILEKTKKMDSGLHPGINDRSKDDSMTRAKPQLKFDTRSKILDSTEVRDTKKKDAINAALRNMKDRKYVYTSGNLRSQIEKHRKNNRLEET